MLLNGKEYVLSSDYDYKEGGIQPIKVHPVDNKFEKNVQCWIVYTA